MSYSFISIVKGHHLPFHAIDRHVVPDSPRSSITSFVVQDHLNADVFPFQNLLCDRPFEISKRSAIDVRQLPEDVVAINATKPAQQAADNVPGIIATSIATCDA
jgi:hypothetical protein